MPIHSNPKKIINDPVYGFVNIPYPLVFELIEHPWFQRLRRIKQLGLSNLIYPGAIHTRFQHVIGAMSLCYQAIDTLRGKGVNITEDEKEATCIAVLLHDMGHGPFSHTLEGILIKDMPHEALSLAYMKALNDQFNGRLDLAIAIFTNSYAKVFLHQLVSSQLDMDRLDYLRRDSFYTGVQEGVIGHDRIISMLNVVDDQLAIDEKGIYSIEKFLIARRLMYWQVYLHKTVISAEMLLVKIIERALLLAQQGKDLFATPAFRFFLYGNYANASQTTLLETYAQLDDHDVMASVKVWCHHSDPILADLCQMLCNRNLPAIIIQNTAFTQEMIDAEIAKVCKSKKLEAHETAYFVYTDSVKNRAYNFDDFHIRVVYKNGEKTDITQASDLYNLQALSHTVTKYFLCYPKND